MRGRKSGTFSAPPQRAVDGLFAALRTALNAGKSGANLTALERVDDWSAIARLAKRHRVVSLTLRGLRRTGLVSPEAEAALGPARAAANARGLSQLAGLRAAVDCLDSHNIPSLVLKGLPLGVRLFGAPLERECYDLDLLVPPSAASAAADALSLGGWSRREPSFEPTQARDRYFERFVKNRIFAGPGGTLELHHRLTNNPFALPASFEELEAAAAAVEAGGSTYSMLGDNDLLVYLCVHGELHRWSRLKWLCDIAALIASVGEDGFEAAVEHGRRLGLAPAPVFGTAMRLCREDLHVELPAAAAALAAGGRSERQARRTRSLWTRPGGSKGLQGAVRRIDELKIALAINPSWRGAAHEAARLLASPYDLGRVDLPDRLFWLYMPLRPILWLAGRRDRRKAAAKSAPPAADSRAETQPGSASAPNGALVYVIGDVHGRLEPLADLLEMVRRDASREQAARRVLIFLGDYVDRGPQSREVIDLLLDGPAPGFETVFLKGNHEAWLLAFLEDASVGEHWLAGGGLATLLSYKVAAAAPVRTADALESLRKAFAAALPEKHRTFLAGLATTHVEGDYAFAHAGIRPGVPLAEQREEDLLWGSEEFIEDARDHGKVIVHGHWYASEPVVRRNRIGIDTGAFATGRLTCLVLRGATRRFLST